MVVFIIFPLVYLASHLLLNVRRSCMVNSFIMIVMT